MLLVTAGMTVGRRIENEDTLLLLKVRRLVGNGKSGDENADITFVEDETSGTDNSKMDALKKLII
jgi:hypothetical protein